MGFYNRFKKALAVAGVLLAMAGGYLAVNITTACRAEAYVCICSAPCISSGVTTSIVRQAAEILADIGLATAAVTADWSLKSGTLPLGLVGLIAAVDSAIDAAEKNLIGAFDELWYNNLHPAMQAMSRQIIARDSGFANVLARFNDANNINRARLLRMEEELKTHRSMRPSAEVCTVATVVGPVTGVNKLSQTYAATAPAEALDRSAIRKGTATAPRGEADDANRRWQRYKERYCDPDVNAGAAGCDAATTFMNRDIDVQGEIFAHTTLPVDEESVQVREDLIMNLVEPFVQNPIDGQVLEEPQAGQLVSQNEEYKAKRQTAYDAVYYIISRRLPSAPAGQGVNYLAQIRQNAGVDAGRLSDTPSRYEFFQTMMSDRYRSGVYSGGQIDETENSDRERAVQRSIEFMWWQETHDLLDRYMLVLAADAGAKIIAAKPMPNRLRELNR